MKTLEIKSIQFKMNWLIIKYGRQGIIGKHALFNKYMNKLRINKINQSPISIIILIYKFHRINYKGEKSDPNHFNLDILEYAFI